MIWRYNYSITYTETLDQPIGSSSSSNISTVLPVKDVGASGTGSESIFISEDGDDSGGSGTQADPYRTLDYALNNLSSASVVTILDSGTYYSGVSGQTFLDLDAITVQGAVGQSPIITVDTSLGGQTEMVDISNSGGLINVQLIIPSTYDIKGILISSGVVYNVTIDGCTQNAVETDGTGTMTLRYCKIQNGIKSGVGYGNAIKINQGTMTVENCLITDNAANAILLDGGTTKTITVNNGTLANNLYGFNLGTSSNNSITINNSIIYGNQAFDYNGNGGNINYSNVPRINGSANRTGTTIGLSPLFDSDYRLKSIYNGTDSIYVFSACIGTNLVTGEGIGISSDGESDLGCYVVTRAITNQSFTEFTTGKSLGLIYSQRSINAALYFGKNKKARIVKDGKVNFVTVSWQGETNVLTQSEFNNIKAMHELGGDIYLSVDGGVNFKEYKIDDTQQFTYEPGVNKEDIDVWMNVSIGLIEL